MPTYCMLGGDSFPTGERATPSVGWALPHAAMIGRMSTPASPLPPPAGFTSAIYGIGTDVCDIRRIRDTFERHGERFVQRVLSDGEQAVWRRRSERWPERGVRYLATRFSAKEAFSKAIGTGMHWPMQWRWCEIANAPSGQPHIVLHGELQAWCAERGLHFHITVSDESDYATSFCVAERMPQA